MRTTVIAALAAATLGSGPAFAQDGPATARMRVAPDTPLTLAITAPDLLGANGQIDTRFTQYGNGTSPALSWTAGPDGTQSYVLVLEDPIAARNLVVLHWLAYNIPTATTALREGIPPGVAMDGVAGAVQVPGRAGTPPGYRGPRPPAGDAPHSYTFQIFALDTTLDVPADANLDAVIAAMEGHILAVGELVAPYAAPAATP